MLTPLAGTARVAQSNAAGRQQRAAEEIAKGAGHRAGADERDGSEAAEQGTSIFDLAGDHVQVAVAAGPEDSRGRAAPAVRVRDRRGDRESVRARRAASSDVSPRLRRRCESDAQGHAMENGAHPT